MIKAAGKLRTVLIIGSILLLAIALYLLWYHPRATSRQVLNSAKANPTYQKNLTTFRLNGRVKSIREENYKSDVLVSELPDSITTQQLTFDERGNLTAVVSFINGRLAADCRYTYDDAGNYTLQTCYTGNGTVKTMDTIVFDSKGRVYRESSGNTTSRVQRVYVIHDRPDGYIKELHDSSLDSTVHIVYTYDSLKRELLMEEKTDSIRDRQITQFDAYGNPIGFKRYWFSHKSMGELVYEFRASYNSKRLLMQKMIGDYNIWRPKKDIEMYYAYDEKGNVIEYTEIERGYITPDSYKATYTYDDEGNWIHRAILKLDGSPKTSVDRVIEYY